MLPICIIVLIAQVKPEFIVGVPWNQKPENTRGEIVVSVVDGRTIFK
jgi:hypothetical protein